MRKITQEEFDKAVELHVKWRNSEEGGVRVELTGVDFSGIDFSGSNLSYSDLRGSNLSYSNLSGSNLSGSNLRSADLRSADLVLIKADEYQIYINSKTMQIGCQNHTHEEWFSFDEQDLADMQGSDNGIERWAFWRPLLKTVCDQLAANAKAKEPESGSSKD